MNYKIVSNSLFTKILVLLILLSQGVSLLGVPKVKGMSVRLGSSPRVNRFSWATISCGLTNPDPTEQTIEVRLVDKLKGAYKQKNVFTEVVTLPPKVSINYSSMVIVEDAEEYFLEIFHNGKQIGKSDSSILSLVSGKTRPVPVFNDSLDEDFGSFSLLPPFKGVFNPTFFSARFSFDQWELCKVSPFIVMVKPDFSQFSTRKFQAVIDYVKQGGNLIFAHPDGLKDALKTPLAPLIPLRPLRTRQVTRLPSMGKVIPGFKEYTNPVPFIETIPEGNGITLLSEGEFPVIRWKKYGLGTVRAAAVPISKDSYTTDEQWIPLLKLFFAHHALLNDTDPVKSTLDEMTGFSVPGIESVRWVILLYFLLLAIPLGLGLYFRKTGYAWIAGGVFAVIFALTLLNQAASGSKDKKGVFLSFVEMVVSEGNSVSGEGYYGLMSSSDTVVDVKTQDASIMLSAIPPSETKITMMGMNKGNTPPTEVKTINGDPEISGLNLPLNSPRHFYAAFSKTIPKEEQFEYPSVKYKNGVLFKQWKMPKGIKADSGWLQFPGGEIPLNIENGVVSQISGRKAFESDNILQSVKTFVQKGWRHNNPMLILAENANETKSLVLKDTIPHGKKLVVIPVSEEFDSEEITVAPESISLSPGDPSTRLIMDGNEIKPSVYSRGSGSFLFKFQIPPALALMTPEKIELDFSYLNDGGNILIEPYILGETKIIKVKVQPKRPPRKRQPKKKKGKKNKKGKKKQPPKPETKPTPKPETKPTPPPQPTFKEVLKREEVKAKKTEDGQFLFDNLTGVFEPNTGAGLIGLRISIKNKDIPLGAREKANTWSLEKFNISVSGKLPMTEEKIIY